MKEPLLATIRQMLTDEDEIAHGEAVVERDGKYVGLGECAYDDQTWPCRTQRGIDRLLAILDDAPDDLTTKLAADLHRPRQIGPRYGGLRTEIEP